MRAGVTKVIHGSWIDLQARSQTQLRVGVSHVFTMADNISLEQKVFTQSFDEIVTVLSSNLTDTASKLVAKGLILQDLYDNIVYPVPGITEKQRAGQLVYYIGDVVKSSGPLKSLVSLLEF